MGTCNGIATIVRGTSIPEFIGRADIGAVSGAMSAAVAMMRAIAPFAAALMLQAGDGNSYSAMLKVLTLIGLLSVAAFWLASSLASRQRSAAAE